MSNELARMHPSRFMPAATFCQTRLDRRLLQWWFSISIRQTAPTSWKVEWIVPNAIIVTPPFSGNEARNQRGVLGSDISLGLLPPPLDSD